MSDFEHSATELSESDRTDLVRRLQEAADALYVTYNQRLRQTTKDIPVRPIETYPQRILEAQSKEQHLLDKAAALYNQMNFIANSVAENDLSKS